MKLCKSVKTTYIQFNIRFQLPNTYVMFLNFDSLGRQIIIKI